MAETIQQKRCLVLVGDSVNGAILKQQISKEKFPNHFLVDFDDIESLIEEAIKLPADGMIIDPKTAGLSRLSDKDKAKLAQIAKHIGNGKIKMANNTNRSDIPEIASKLRITRLDAKQIVEIFSPYTEPY